MRNKILQSGSVDETINALSALAFSVAVGAAGVAIPLLAVAAGYGPVEVGVLIAISGAAQLGGRLQISRIMRRFPDKALVVASGLLMIASCLVLVWSLELWSFVLSQVLQGVARAYFWTGSQSHVVRTGDRSMPALARLNLAGGIGSLMGPIIAGLLAEQSGRSAMLAAACAAAVAAILAALLTRYRPFEKLADRTGSIGVWRRPEVRSGNLMCLISGSWRGVLSSSIPVVLALTGITPAVIGLLVAVANVAVLAGSAAVGLFRSPPTRATLLIGGSISGLGLATIGVLAAHPVPVAILLAVSGLAAGVIHTVGTAVVSDAVHLEERGEAIASTGTFRAAALILTPLITAGLAIVTPLGPAIAITGVLIALPSLLGGSGGRNQPENSDSMPRNR